MLWKISEGSACSNAVGILGSSLSLYILDCRDDDHSNGISTNIENYEKVCTNSLFMNSPETGIYERRLVPGKNDASSSLLGD